MNNGSGLNWNTLTQLAQNRMMQMNQPMMPQPQLPALGVIFVDGRAGVDSFPLPPNCEGVPLFDRITGELYVKATDAYGNAKVTEYEAPIVKKSEADVQKDMKDMLVAMNERMNRIEDIIEKLVQGGDQNGKPYSGSSEQSKRAKYAKTDGKQYIDANTTE